MSSINSNNGVSSSFPVPDNSSSNVGKSSKLGNHNISNKGDAKQAESASKSFDAARLAIGRALGGSSVRSSAPLSSRISTSSGGDQRSASSVNPPPAPPLPSDLGKFDAKPLQLPPKSSSPTSKTSEMPQGKKTSSGGFLSELQKAISSRGGNEEVVENTPTPGTSDPVVQQNLSLPKDSDLPFDPATTPPPLPSNFGSSSAASMSSLNSPTEKKTPSSRPREGNAPSSSGLMNELKAKLQQRSSSAPNLDSGSTSKILEKSQNFSAKEATSMEKSQKFSKDGNVQRPVSAPAGLNFMEELKATLQRRNSVGGGNESKNEDTSFVREDSEVNRSEVNKESSRVEEGPLEYPPVDYDSSKSVQENSSRQDLQRTGSRRSLSESELPPVDYNSGESRSVEQASKESSKVDGESKKSLPAQVGDKIRKFFNRRKSL
ncbi:hypothetical protein [Chlamydiifrater volucris]|uniref:hypothetical protein n=1 Tax=Chlamydiifrater volucris TaxID=2681470 RepID=UPI001BCD0D9C|nr:hypothetical protein [Chlamydiifrater volucris]